jgi:hypothetical protein
MARADRATGGPCCVSLARVREEGSMRLPDRVRRALGSVEAAALAGIAAAVLFTLAAYLLARQPGVVSASTDRSWYADADHRFTVMVGLNLAPLGVIAFLWFMAVIRRRLGDREDRFFATVFLGSGLAFAMLVTTAAVAAATPTLVVRFGDQSTPDRTTVVVAHALWFGLWGVSASRLVGVFMVATSTVGLRFGAFPRWLSLFGLVLGAVLGITGAFVGPLDFLFPVWLIVVSSTLLLTRRGRDPEEAVPRETSEPVR